MGYHGKSWASMESHSKTMGKPWVFAGYMGMWISLGGYKNFILDRSLSRIADGPSEKCSLSVPRLVDLRSKGRKKKRQMACKPGSVHRPRTAGWPFIWDARYRTPRATDPGGDAEMRLAGEPAHRPYLVLLLVGFTMPLPLPDARCALTAPFHPYLPGGRRSALCGTFPRVAPAGRYPAPYFRGARTFLPVVTHGAAIRPSGADAP